MKNKENLAVFLENYRKKRNLSLEEFAGQLGISRSALQDYCKGKGNPTLSTLTVLADGLAVPLSEMLAGEEPRG